MKLLSCYIEGFGTFLRKSFNFDERLSAFCENNGFGKTTLAHFISTMFYGMPTIRANVKEFTEREHYFPFDTNACSYYGGTITFEWRGKEYKIEKSFDVKSDTKDVCTVYANGIKVEDFKKGDEIGNSVFGIDKDAFEKTVFVDFECVDSSTNASINAMLGDKSASFGDDTLVDKAIKSLESEMANYKSKTGRGDSKIKECDTKISALKTQIANDDGLVNALPTLKAQLNNLTKESATVKKDVEKANAYNTLKAKWETYNNLKRDADGYENVLTNLKVKYRLGMPQPAEIEGALESANEIVVLNSAKKTTEQDEENKKKLACLEQTFKAGVPTEENLIDITNQIQSLLNDEHAVKRENGELKRQTQTVILPSKTELEKLVCDKKRYDEIEEKLKKTPKYSATNDQKGNYLLPLIICGVAFAVGIVAFLFSVVAGAIITALGAIGLLIFGVMTAKNKGQTVGTKNAEWVELNAKKTAVYDSIAETLRHYNCFDSNLGVGVYRLEQAVANSLADSEKRSESEQKIKTLQAQIDDSTAKLNAYFNGFGIFDASFDKRLFALRDAINDFAHLKTAHENRLRAIENAESAILEKKNEIKNFFNSYEIVVPTSISEIKQTLKEIATDVETHLKAQKLCAQKLEEMQAYMAKNNLTPLDQVMFDEDRLRVLQIKKNALDERILGVKADIERAERATESLAKAKADLEQELEKRAEYTAKHAVLEKAINALKQADKNLKEKFVKPANKTFEKYSAKILQKLGVRPFISGEFTLQFEKNGVLHHEQFLSAGQRAITSLCYRLALIENMYKTDLPFIILDDPFVNLDEENLKIVKGVLGDLCKTFQIIYLSCHASRMI